jgi:hypothetical protein
MDVSPGAWYKSSYSVEQTNCVEVAHLSGRVALRDSQHPEQAVLTFDHPTWTAFLAQVTRQG